MSAEPGVAICTACGVCAPASRPACGVCGLAFPTPRAAAPPPGGDRMWAAVRAGFTCRGCGFLAPLDHLPTDGAVECASCGLRQVFDTTPLGPALAHAHAAADLAGPRPEGRVRHPRVWIGSDNPFHDVGVDRALAPCAGLDPMQLEAGPGYPVCGKCKVPLGVQAQGGVVVTQCPRCGEGARYLLPEGAQALAPGLVGIVSPDHSDRPRARESAGAGGVVALMCPSCGAPLQATPGERMVACGFCRAVALIPARAAARSSDKPPKPATFWLLFDGASAKRLELETPVVDYAGPGAGAAVAVLGSFATKLKRAPAGDRIVDTAQEVPGVGVAQLVLSLVAAAVLLAVTDPIAIAAVPDAFPQRAAPEPPAQRAAPEAPAQRPAPAPEPPQRERPHRHGHRR